MKPTKKTGNSTRASGQKTGKPPVATVSSMPSVLVIVSGLVLSLAVSIGLTHLIAGSPIDPVEFTLPSPFSLPNDSRLTSSELLLENEIYGPESLAIHPTTGKIYTGLKTGLICELDLTGEKPKIVRAVRLNSVEGCDGSYKSMPKCGRPLGMRFNKEKELMVVDAYLGLFSINWETEKVHQLFAGGAIMKDEHSKSSGYLNDLDFLPDGRIVISESSSKFEDRDYLLDMLEHRPNGRILVFDPRSMVLDVLADDLYFPNGVLVFRGKVLFSEMGKSRIMRLCPSSGKLTVFMDRLPGYPDNLRRSPTGGIWVAMSALRTEEDNWIAQRPPLRKLLTKLLSPQALNYVAGYFTTKAVLLIKVDPESGEIIDSLMDLSGKVSDISTAIEDSDGNIFMGNDDNYYIARYTYF